MLHTTVIQKDIYINVWIHMCAHISMKASMFFTLKISNVYFLALLITLTMFWYRHIHKQVNDSDSLNTHTHAHG